MTTYRYYTLDVFTERAFAGNPLAVVPDAGGLDSERMQLLAREFNYSESAFVLPPGDHDPTITIRIFTPAEELPFAGHPTIGTAFLLASIGAIPLEKDRTKVIFSEGAGRVPVTVEALAGLPVRTELTAPQPFASTPAGLNSEDLAAGLSLSVDDLMGEDEPAVMISCGLPFLLLPLRGLDAARRAKLDSEAWRRRIGNRAPAMIYVLSRECDGEADAHVRLFAPEVGVSEDAATGSAATALAGYLAERAAETSGDWHWTIEQGIEMGRPSRLEISAEKREGQLTALRCAGACARVFAGTFEL